MDLVVPAAQNSGLFGQELLTRGHDKRTAAMTSIRRVIGSSCAFEYEARRRVFRSTQSFEYRERLVE